MCDQSLIRDNQNKPKINIVHLQPLGNVRCGTCMLCRVDLDIITMFVKYVLDSFGKQKRPIGQTGSLTTTMSSLLLWTQVSGCHRLGIAE